MISDWICRLGRVGAARRDNRFVRRLDRHCIRFHEAYENRNYDIRDNGEGRVLSVLGRVLEAHNIFDVGANTGEWTAAAAKEFPAAQINSFEVVTTTHDQLRQKCLPLSNVRTYSFGLSDVEENVDIFIVPSISMLATCVAGITETFHNRIPQKVSGHVMRGDQFCAQHGICDIDLLKIDVEGMESRVLAGLSGMLHAGRVKIIQFEYGYVNVAVRFLLKDFYELLRPLGYVIGKIYPCMVDFRDYRYQHEDFIGPNFLAVHESQASLIAALQSDDKRSTI